MCKPGSWLYRVGRILVRKLQLRGYPVRVLVRPDNPEATYFPESVKVIKGEAGDYRSLRAAMQGVDKVGADSLSPPNHYILHSLPWHEFVMSKD